MLSTVKAETLAVAVSALSSGHITIDRTMLTNNDMASCEHMYNTNLAMESRRRNRRSADVVKRHTVIGYYAEKAVISLLSQTKLKIDTPPITPGAVGVHYFERKHDLRFHLPSEDETPPISFKMEVKTSSNRWYSTIPLSDAAAKSVVSAMSVSDFLIYLTWAELRPWQFRFQPRFIIDTHSMAEHDNITAENLIIDGIAGWYSPYRFDTRRAKGLNSCISLDIGERTSYNDTLQQFIS